MELAIGRFSKAHLARRLSFLFLAAMLVGVGSVNPAAAFTHVRGSDVLEGFIDAVLMDPACLGVGNIMFVGGGSSSAQNEMVAGSQQVAPMTRFFTQPARSCTEHPEAEGLVFGLSGVAITANKAESDACGLALATTKNIDGYELGGWRDVLSILYFGRDKTTAPRDCNSALRRTIANNWSSLFEGACKGNTCSKLSHIWRTSDDSSATAVFVTIVSGGHPSGVLPFPTPFASGINPFCNGCRSFRRHDLGSYTTVSLGRLLTFNGSSVVGGLRL